MILRPTWAYAAVFLVAGCLAALSANAEITVRSGEHPGHSRLVLDFDRVPTWRLEDRPGGYFLRLDPWDGAIALEDVFYYIPRTRLADLRVDPAAGGLVLELGCVCPVEASVSRNHSLVIDIHDPDPDRAAAEIANIAAMTDGPIILLAGTTAEVAPDVPSQDVPPEFSPVPDVQPTEPVLPFSDNTLQGTDLLEDSLTRTLAQELARAAAQGMVEAGRELWKTDGAEDVLDPPPPTDGARSAPEPSNIRIRSGFDALVEPGIQPELAGISPQMACPSPASYALESWSDGTAPHLQIAALRGSLIGEFDKVDRRSAVRLARLYAHYGFGAEARAVLEQLIPGDPAAAAIVPLSHLIESGSAGGELVRFAECGGSLPLWALLDEDPDAPLGAIKSEAILLTFTGLPPHLRRYLGYRAAARFAARGDFTSAEMIRATLERISEPNDPALLLSTTQTAEIEETTQDVGAALAELAVSLQPEAAEALILSIGGYLARGERVPLDLIDTAGALAFELGGHSEGRLVKSAQIQALFANMDFEGGFEELLAADSGNGLSREQVAAAWQDGFERLLKVGEDAEFVSRLYGDEAANGLSSLPGTLRQALAERLLELGFPMRAEAVAPAGAQGSDGLFSARLALARGDLDRALGLVRVRRNPEARRFAAEILGRAGRHAEAQSIYAAIAA
ncbi:MAG: hypothetical protein AAF566_13355, partial [Pseudomonadota bacterium]